MPLRASSASPNVTRAQLEAACGRALDHDSPLYRTVKTVLTCRVELLTTEAADRTAALGRLARARFPPSAPLFLTEIDHDIGLWLPPLQPEGDP